jgi:hypothetical protein
MRALVPLVLLATSLVSGCSSSGRTASARPHLLTVPRETPQLDEQPLSPEAEALLRQRGFVISATPHIPSFHLGYTAVFRSHAPVYFTADSVLHAVHRSYNSIFELFEREVLFHQLEALLAELRRGLEQTTDASPEARAELDLFLAVAEGLRQGSSVPPVAGARHGDVERWLDLARAEGPCERSDPFAPLSSPQPPPSAAERLNKDWPLKSIARMDLSMLRPRGRYTQSPELCRYFQAMMWLGRAELHVAEWSKKDRAWRVNHPGLEAMLLLESLLSPRAEEAWRRIDSVTTAFVGPADSLSFPGLRRAARARGLHGPAGLRGLADAELVAALQPESRQRILSGFKLRPEEGKEPLQFLLLGQRYVFDSEVLSAVSYGQLEQKRMMPSPLDVAAAALRNPAARRLLSPELERYGYADALDAVARRGDEAGPELWEGSLYHLWLGALRDLSPDTQRDRALPAPLRSEDWGRRMLSSQLASWAELRHDTLLYAKQSYSGIAICEFPDAYVDPYPGFYRVLGKFAARGGALAAGLDFQQPKEKARIEAYFDRLGEVVHTLGDIAERQQRGERLTADQLDFMNHAVSVDGKTAGCTTVFEPGGWYADLYFDRDHVLAHEAVVADVHTQPTEANGAPVGKVLHAGTGKPRLMAVTLDTGSGPRTYQGFVSSYFEQTTRDFQRLDDAAWMNGLSSRQDVSWMSPLIAP